MSGEVQTMTRRASAVVAILAERRVQEAHDAAAGLPSGSSELMNQANAHMKRLFTCFHIAENRDLAVSLGAIAMRLVEAIDREHGEETRV